MAQHVSPDELTSREKEVARLIAQSKTDNQIAYELQITFGGVRLHVDNLLQKLGVSSRVAICQWWYDNVVIPKIRGEKA